MIVVSPNIGGVGGGGGGGVWRGELVALGNFLCRGIQLIWIWITVGRGPTL